MKHISKLFSVAAGMATVVLVAAPASAEPCTTDALGRSIPHFPPGCTVTGPTPAPTGSGSTSTSTGSGGGGVGAWLSEHAGLIVLAVMALIAWAVWAGHRQEKEEEKKQAASHAAGALARGRQIAMNANAEPEAQSPADLQRYSTFGWAVPWQQGTAFGTLVTRDGGTSRVHAAWTEACELARLGHWDEAGVFTPAATVVNVNGYSDGSGDLELSVSTRDYSVGERELNRVLGHLTRTARVETASAFTRNAAKDWHITRLSMIPEQQKQQESEPEQPAAPDPTAAWEW